MLPLAVFTLHQKRVLDSLFGEADPRADIPRLLSFHREGELLLDEMINTEYRLADVDAAYDDTRQGKIIRGVIEHETGGND